MPSLSLPINLIASQKDREIVFDLIDELDALKAAIVEPDPDGCHLTLARKRQVESIVKRLRKIYGTRFALRSLDSLLFCDYSDYARAEKIIDQTINRLAWRFAPVRALAGKVLESRR